MSHQGCVPGRTVICWRSRTTSAMRGMRFADIAKTRGGCLIEGENNYHVVDKFLLAGESQLNCPGLVHVGWGFCCLMIGC